MNKIAIINLHAGRLKNKVVRDRLVSKLRDNCAQIYDFNDLLRRGALTEAIFNQPINSHIIVAGGDGTQRTIVQRMLRSGRTDMRLCLLPCGTVNLFVSSYANGVSPDEFLDKYHSMEEVRVSIGVLDDEVFLNFAMLGLAMEELVYMRERARGRGRTTTTTGVLRFLRALYAPPNGRRIKLLLKSCGQDWSMTATNVLVTPHAISPSPVGLASLFAEDQVVSDVVGLTTSATDGLSVYAFKNDLRDAARLGTKALLGQWVNDRSILKIDGLAASSSVFMESKFLDGQQVPLIVDGERLEKRIASSAELSTREYSVLGIRGNEG